MVVADECRIQEEPNPVYRWNEKGQTPIIKVKRDKNHNKSIYGGLSMANKMVISHFCDWQNSEETVNFLEKIKIRRNQLAEMTGQSLPIILVWDNVSYHKSQLIKDWLRSNPNTIELMNTPPYTPKLNPQERVWRALKQFLATLKAENYVFNDLVVQAEAFLNRNIFDYEFPVC